jgi:hypothetical protein
MLPRGSDLDWSVAVIGLCKAFEVEVIRRLREPMRDQLRTLDLIRDFGDRVTRELALYVAGKTSRPPALGTIAFIFGLAGKASAATSASPLLEAIRGAAVAGKSDWLIAGGGFAATVRDLTRQYRNRAVHIDSLGRPDFDMCRELLFGSAGVFPTFYSHAYQFANALAFQ